MKLSKKTLSVLVAVTLMIVASGCGNKATVPDDEAIPSAGLDSISGSSDNGDALGLKTINFEYDSFSLTSSAKSTLQGNINIMKATLNARIEIEGHCDERGSIQYNIALGEKRANSVRSYLVDRGISGDRLSIISFGEEKPIDDGHNDTAWSKNRRANFVIVAK